MLKEDKISATIVEDLKKTDQSNVTIENGNVILKGDASEKFFENYYEYELKMGVEFPKDMIEDEFYKPMIEQVKKEHSKLVTENKDTITIKGDALKKFDELCMEAWNKIDSSEVWEDCGTYEECDTCDYSFGAGEDVYAY